MDECLLNFNDALQTSFVFKMAKSPLLTYSTQNVTFPSISVNDIPVNYKNYNGYVPSNTIQYEPLNLSFVVDENFINYDYLYKQLLIYSQKPQSGNISEVFDELHVFRLNSAKKPIADIVFHNTFCTNLSSIDYNTNSSTDDMIICNATFRYQTFDIIPL